MTSSINKELLNGIEGYRLTAGPYSAFICEEKGANCIQLTKGEASLLRTPSSREDFFSQPNLYGIPLLFPPNRINGGRYVFAGREYSFPINDIERGHHIHGFLSSTPFRPIKQKTTPESASICFTYEATKSNPYLSFGHEFCVTLCFTLDEAGLGMELTITNTSGNPMPVGLGFHTTFNADFLRTGDEQAYVLKVGPSKEILIDRPTFMPTGEYCQDNELLRELRQGTYRPYGKTLSSHFSTNDEEVHKLWYTHVEKQASINYTINTPLDYWMLFNKGGYEGFVCAEPQTWIIDAPNSKLDPKQSGFRSLAGGESLTLRSHLSMIGE